MPDEDQLYVETPPQQQTVVMSADAIAARLPQLPTRTEMWRAVLLGVTTGAGLVQCLAWLFRASPMQIFWSLMAIASMLAIIFILTQPQAD